jgi:hypothetical protein
MDLHFVRRFDLPYFLPELLIIMETRGHTFASVASHQTETRRTSYNVG